MTALPPDLEALMPEPITAFRDKGTFTLEEKFFTADQVRAVMLAVTERAAKVVESGPPPRKLEGGRVEIGEGARRAFAAAIRGTGSGA